MLRQLSPDIVTKISTARAAQQPKWDDESEVAHVRAILASRQGLVKPADIRTLRSFLARVAVGDAHIVQCGDCAEDPEDRTAERVWRKSAVADLLAGELKMITHTPIVRAGRIAGQFAKPRTSSIQDVQDLRLPAFRGHMVNDPAPDPKSRRHDPMRMLTGYVAAKEIMEQLGWNVLTINQAPERIEQPLWTSHEALLMDYELPMIRDLGGDQRWLSSTHWPWIGERTRQPDGAHVALLSEVINPVSCKIGPSTSVDEILALCELLDPRHSPGRLTLISRMGAGSAAERLPKLVEAVSRSGHPVIWLCDPMHGNTISTPEGKTRLLSDITQEIREFQRAVVAGGGVAGGLHLETTPDDVTECAVDSSAVRHVGDRWLSPCDPRLNPEQAVSVVSAWSNSA
jgi:3-deoxy-7-phosphoheptulonate synthase